MPGGDGRGPMGMGPMTGRTAGYCAGYNVPGYMNPVGGRRGFGFGRGFGRGGGWGRGRGWGRGWGASYAYNAPAYGGYPYASEITAEEERAMLKEQSDALKQQLDDIQSRLDSFEAEENQKKQ